MIALSLASLDLAQRSAPMPASYNDALGQLWAVDVDSLDSDRIVFQSHAGIRVAECIDPAFGERVKCGAVSLPELRPYFVRSRAPNA